MTPEARVKKQVRRLLEQMGAYHFPAATHGYGSSGLPDIVACLNGQFVAIECKAGKNKPTKLQAHNLDQIKAAGGVALVINENNLNTLEGTLKLLTKLLPPE